MVDKWAVNSHVRQLQNFCQLSFLEFDSNVFIAILSIHNQRFFNLTKYREVIVNNSLLTLYAEMQICFLVLVVVTTNRFFFK